MELDFLNSTFEYPSSPPTNSFIQLGPYSHHSRDISTDESSTAPAHTCSSEDYSEDVSGNQYSFDYDLPPLTGSSFAVQDESDPHHNGGVPAMSPKQLIPPSTELLFSRQMQMGIYGNSNNMYPEFYHTAFYYQNYGIPHIAYPSFQSFPKRKRSVVHNPLNQTPISDNSFQTFKCDKCPSVFKRNAELRRHNSSIHFQTKTFVCPSCFTTFGRRDALKRHANSRIAGKQCAGTRRRTSKCDSIIRHELYGSSICAAQ